MLSKLAEWLRETIAADEDDKRFWNIFGAKEDPRFRADMEDRDHRIERSKKLLKKCEEHEG